MAPPASRHILPNIANFRRHLYYKAGDFIVSDNLAVGHEASASTQRPPSEIGLRVMHRVTIAGKTRPRKHGDT